jgi:hypothetical protein
MLLKRQSNPLIRRILRSLRWAKEDQNSTRNTPGNRNHWNSRVANDLIFSTRNKRGGVAAAASSPASRMVGLPASSSRPALVAPEPAFVWRAKAETSRILIATRASRNDLNSAEINETALSNRNKTGGRRQRQDAPLKPAALHLNLKPSIYDEKGVENTATIARPPGL